MNIPLMKKGKAGGGNKFSAYFMGVLKMNSLVTLLGDGVEIGEDLFIVGGVDDPRDRHANKDGRRFG